MTVFPVFPRRRLLLNGAAIFGGEAVARSATLLMAVVVARRFGPAALGEYGYALALASILLLVPDFGMHLFAVRELSTEPGRLPQLFWNIHWLKFFLTGGVALFAVFAGKALLPDAAGRWLFYVLVARILLQTYSQACMAVFKAYERMHYVALQQSANSLVVVAWVAAALVLQENLWTVVAALVAGQAVETYLGWRTMKASFSPGRIARWDRKLITQIMLASFPIGITTVLQALDFRIDILVLGRYVPQAVLGQFQAVAWFPVGIFLATSLLMSILFPKLSRLLRHQRAQRAAYVMGLLKNGLLITVLGSLVVWFAAPALLAGIFGKSLAPAAATLRIMTPMLPLVFLNTLLFYVFVAAGRRAVYLGTLGCGVTVGLFLSVILTARYGVLGCALADMARELVMSALNLFFLVRGKHEVEAGTAFLKVFVTATLLLVVAAAINASRIHAGQWCAAWMFLVFSGTLLLLGFPRRSEWRLLTDDSL